MAIGFLDGKVMIWNMDKQLTIKQCVFDPKEWSEVMKYNPSESLLAVGSHDNHVYIYESKGYSLLTKCVAHSSYITCLDWAADKNTIRTNCGAYELLYFDIPNKQTPVTKNDPRGAATNWDTNWASLSIKFEWAVQGIFPIEVGSDGTHINSVDTNFSKNIIVTGDDFGLINILNYPCIENWQSIRLKAHSEHVCKIWFAADGDYIISTGGYDQTIFVWKWQGASFTFAEE